LLAELKSLGSHDAAMSLDNMRLASNYLEELAKIGNELAPCSR
jgi:hypothetical protein